MRNLLISFMFLMGGCVQDQGASREQAAEFCNQYCTAEGATLTELHARVQDFGSMRAVEWACTCTFPAVGAR